MRATIKNSMRQLGMKKIVVFVCGFLVTSMTIAACSDLTGLTSPETPINVTTTLASPTSVRVDWTKSPQSDGVVSYNILRNGTKVGESTTFSYTDTGLAEKTTYKYTVSANCTSGLLSEASAQTAAATVTTGDVTPPRFVRINPVDGQTDVSTFATVTAAFNEAMDTTTINTTTFSLKVTSGGANIPGTVTYTAATRLAEFTPTNQLPSSTSITVTITAGVKDISGNALLLTAGSPGIWSFTTADQTPPTIIATSPANGASGVSATAPITVTFSEAMGATTIHTSSFTLRVQSTGAAVAGTVTYNAETHVATFTPSSTLASLENYTATISSSVKDVAGNAMGENVQFSFTTRDTTAPTVVSTSPADLATNVATNPVISAIFSKPMDATTINTTTFTLKVTATGAAVTGTVAYSVGNPATFTPSATLASGTPYTATITTGAKDLSGNALTSNFAWTFVTVDNVPPTVVSTVPTVGATNVAIGATVTATFSEAMDTTTINGTTFTLKTTGGTAVTGTVTYDVPSKTARFTPSSPLLNNTGYTATITTGVKDLAGNAMAANKVFAFTTIADTTPPTVSSTSPVNGLTAVPVSSVVTVTFSEAMDAATVTAAGTFTLKTTVGGTAVTGTVTYNATTHVATFTPAPALLAATNYTATVTTAAKDLAGNALSLGTLTFTFATTP